MNQSIIPNAHQLPTPLAILYLHNIYNTIALNETIHYQFEIKSGL